MYDLGDRFRLVEIMRLPNVFRIVEEGDEFNTWLNLFVVDSSLHSRPRRALSVYGRRRGFL